MKRVRAMGALSGDGVGGDGMDTRDDASSSSTTNGGEHSSASTIINDVPSSLTSAAAPPSTRSQPPPPQPPMGYVNGTPMSPNQLTELFNHLQQYVTHAVDANEASLTSSVNNLSAEAVVTKLTDIEAWANRLDNEQSSQMRAARQLQLISPSSSTSSLPSLFAARSASAPTTNIATKAEVAQ